MCSSVPALSSPATDRYEHIETLAKPPPVNLARQLLPGTFEHTLHHQLDGPVDLSHFDARFRTDDTVAPAYPPTHLLKVVRFAYSQGLVSSRQTARACQEHVTFIAPCGDQVPHFNTIARFVSTLGDNIKRVFATVLAICDQQDLFGRAMFATDGVRLPSNAWTHWSGTRADFERQATKLEAGATAMLQRHRTTDARPTEPTRDAKDTRRLERLQHDAAQLPAWLAAHLKDVARCEGDRPPKQSDR